jgi:AcrR family transcriptional regulator
MLPADPVTKARSRRERPAKPALTRDGIVDAAVRIMGEQGLERVTMRRLADDLDTGPASLYVYVQNMAELHGAILDRLLAQRVATPASGDWTATLEASLLSYGQILFDHPGLARSVLTLRPAGEHYLELVEALLGLLSDGGVAADRAAWGLDLLLQLMTASAAEHTTLEASPDAPSEAEAQIATVSAADPARFPHLVALADDLVSGEGEERLRWAIRALLTGIRDTPRPDEGRRP